MRLERGGGPPEEPEPTIFEFGELLIGAKFWLGDDQYIKVSVDMARRLGFSACSYYQKFKEDEKVRDIL